MQQSYENTGNWVYTKKKDLIQTIHCNSIILNIRQLSYLLCFSSCDIYQSICVHGTLIHDVCRMELDWIYYTCLCWKFVRTPSIQIFYIWNTIWNFELLSCLESWKLSFSTNSLKHLISKDPQPNPFFQTKQARKTIKHHFSHYPWITVK